MKTVSADSRDIKIRELIEAAREEPVVVTEKDARAAIVLSPSDFDRLDEADRIRREAKDRLRQTISAMQAHAADRGLTADELERLLADES
jgi:PHD/YefM family antitoxin component YafN of YafNO toxin-antitoxin module